MALVERTAELGHRWGWLMVTGLLFVLLGMTALFSPVATTVGLTFAIASLLLAAGAVLLVQAFRLRGHHGAGVRFIQAALAVVAGLMIFFYPIGGMSGIALVLAFYFFISSALHWILSSLMEPFQVRVWGRISAVASFLLGVYIIFSFPFSALWVPGALLGVDLVFNGIGLIGFSLSVKRLTHGGRFRPAHQH